MPTTAICCDCGKKCHGERCRACYSARRSEQVPTSKCRKCGKEFRRYRQYNYRGSNGKYCSRKCSFAAVRDGERAWGKAKCCLPKLTREMVAWFDRWDADATKNVRKVVRCKRKGCGERIYERDTKGRKRKYCSVACAGASCMPWVLANCKGCKKAVAAKNKAVYCKSCLRKRNPQKHRNRCKKFGTFFNPQVRSLDVFRRDGWRCQLCLRKVSVRVPANHPLRASIDHIKPISLGGDHDWQNVQCACRQCNVRKSNNRLGQARMF